MQSWKRVWQPSSPQPFPHSYHNKLSPALSAPSVTDSGKKSSPHLFFSESKKRLASVSILQLKHANPSPRINIPIRKQGQQANKLCQKGRPRGTAPGVMHPTHRASGLSGASRVRRRDRAGSAAARGALVHRARDPATMDPDACPLSCMPAGSGIMRALTPQLFALAVFTCTGMLAPGWLAGWLCGSLADTRDTPIGGAEGGGGSLAAGKALGPVSIGALRPLYAPCKAWIRRGPEGDHDAPNRTP
ncbi:hypothetical protein HETIRDRAFT_101439 [Heterobasidion irregulare TC 32-1]|uniref:Uncharacterized protein n=1 Tax=Heterobasidion irregulare (strain TC 32-1) TaxID=747525 RepID=W4K8E0_HETIT|nr:uncharacterized protein HETIRDRAFT_101439 [Heterobasidion irregulare TC 32-1]ETW82024.1 hypothetical protein HETIRDRAFT_101439 [Heterobasidion irregulare TC 32-1]